ncbi:MAG: hypothetical protein RLZZ500_1266 [Bacteroidota bacterium]|jgi:hypothetical protein
MSRKNLLSLIALVLLYFFVSFLHIESTAKKQFEILYTILPIVFFCCLLGVMYFTNTVKKIVVSIIVLIYLILFVLDLVYATSITFKLPGIGFYLVTFALLFVYYPRLKKINSKKS